MFYPEDLPQSRWLQFYQQEFDTVEINNSFYRLPEAETFAAWRKAAPPGFLYAVKASRYLTHMKRLKDPEEPVARLLSRTRHLDKALGPILYQLPPRFRADIPRLRNFLATLPPDLEHVLEFRDPSWFAPEVYELLRGHGVALCLHDSPAVPAPIEITAPFAYVRFHGPGKNHTGDYPAHRLEEWAERLRAWQEQGIAAFVYFNNDPGGRAIKNARELKQLLESG
ncbi:MAG: DUF72 domain-containing protein [Thermoleophilia bacterium]